MHKMSDLMQEVRLHMNVQPRFPARRHPQHLVKRFWFPPCLVPRFFTRWLGFASISCLPSPVPAPIESWPGQCGSPCAGCIPIRHSLPHLFLQHLLMGRSPWMGMSPSSGMTSREAQEVARNRSISLASVSAASSLVACLAALLARVDCPLSRCRVTATAHCRGQAALGV
jgi:hypothetical protein